MDNHDIIWQIVQRNYQLIATWHNLSWWLIELRLCFLQSSEYSLSECCKMVASLHDEIQEIKQIIAKLERSLS